MKQPVVIDVAPAFDDRSFFQLKARPEFVSMGYLPFKLPNTSLTFATAKGIVLRLGAAEEAVLRPAADLVIKAVELQLSMPLEAVALEQMRHATSDADTEINERTIAAPDFLTAAPKWSPKDLDYFRTHPEYRSYMQVPSLSEKDDDWDLRPFSENLQYDVDNSLRST